MFIIHHVNFLKTCRSINAFKSSSFLFNFSKPIFINNLISSQIRIFKRDCYLQWTPDRKICKPFSKTHLVLTMKIVSLRRDNIGAPRRVFGRSTLVEYYSTSFAYKRACEVFRRQSHSIFVSKFTPRVSSLHKVDKGCLS